MYHYNKYVEDRLNIIIIIKLRSRQNACTHQTIALYSHYNLQCSAFTKPKQTKRKNTILANSLGFIRLYVGLQQKQSWNISFHSRLLLPFLDFLFSLQ